MIGRRLQPIPEVLTEGPNAGREVMRIPPLIEPGDYCGPVIGYTGDIPAVFFLPPNAKAPGVEARCRGVNHVVSPPHVFRECRDGSLEIRESIGLPCCHCYLDEGHSWRIV